VTLSTSIPELILENTASLFYSTWFKSCLSLKFPFHDRLRVSRASPPKQSLVLSLEQIRARVTPPRHPCLQLSNLCSDNHDLSATLGTLKADGGAGCIDPCSSKPSEKARFDSQRLSQSVEEACRNSRFETGRRPDKRAAGPEARFEHPHVACLEACSLVQ
jgi:hypothetical protein